MAKFTVTSITNNTTSLIEYYLPSRPVSPMKINPNGGIITINLVAPPWFKIGDKDSNIENAKMFEIEIEGSEYTVKFGSTVLFISPLAAGDFTIWIPVSLIITPSSTEDGSQISGGVVILGTIDLGDGGDTNGH